jgi:hypothetical protein
VDGKLFLDGQAAAERDSASNKYLLVQRQVKNDPKCLLASSVVTAMKALFNTVLLPEEMQSSKRGTSGG